MNSLEQEILPRINEYLVQNGLSDRTIESIEDLNSSSVDSKDIVKALAHASGLRFHSDPSGLRIHPDFAIKIPIGLARRIGMVLVFNENDAASFVLLTSNIEGVAQLDICRRLFGEVVEIQFADKKSVLSLVNKAYENRQTKTHKIIDSIDNQSPRTLNVDFGEDLLDSDSQAPIINLVNSTLFDAVNQKASDVHFQPYEDRLVIRFRIDGVLFDVFTVPKESQEEVLSRVKVVGKMNIAEKRLPQDGRATVKVGDKRVDLRIASLPTSDGERIVVRLLDKSAELFSLSELGMGEQLLTQFKKLIHREHGMILVTGPTGGGKSTTLYAALQEINATDKNVVTLEDPIEYQLPGISQTQVSEKKGLTFAKGLRNVLRQDPDIIMVGEIRDQETAEMAIQSALTGHLVFSTLHTNDAASSITRLIDLGIEPYLVASSVIGVLAQRLVRRICQNCKNPVPINSQDPNRLGCQWYSDTNEVSVGVGCSHCRETGYSGRLGVFELLRVDEHSKHLIQLQKSSVEIREHARNKNQMSLLSEDGMQKIRAGQTTVDEIYRISSSD